MSWTASLIIAIARTVMSLEIQGKSIDGVTLDCSG